MSRAGYVDDNDDMWGLIRYRGAVRSAIRGARGQAFLRDLLASLDAMPVKELHASKFQADAQFCSLGIAAHDKKIDLSEFEEQAADDDVNHRALARKLGLSEAFVREVMYENDECVGSRREVVTELCGPVRPYYPDYGQLIHRETVPDERAPAKRWQYMRNWVAKQIKASAQGGE